MSDSLLVDVDAREVLRVLDQLGDRAESVLDEVCADAAERIKTEARARLSRQTHGTGRTARAIVAGRERNRKRGYYRVYVAPVPQRPANLPIWLEYGTRHAREFPFLGPAADLEAGGFRRRLHDALQRVLRETT